MEFIEQLRDRLPFTRRQYTPTFVHQCLGAEDGLFDLCEAGRTVEKEAAHERLPKQLGPEITHDLLNRLLAMDDDDARDRCYRELRPFLIRPHTPEFPNPDRLASNSESLLVKLFMDSRSTLQLHTFLANGGCFEDPCTFIDHAIAPVMSLEIFRHTMDLVDVLIDHHPGPKAPMARTALRALLEQSNEHHTTNKNERTSGPRAVMRMLLRHDLPLRSPEYDVSDRTDGSLLAYLAQSLIEESHSEQTRALTIWIQDGGLDHHPATLFISEAFAAQSLPQTPRANDLVFAALQSDDPDNRTRAMLERDCRPSRSYMKRLETEDRDYYEQICQHLPRRARNNLITSC